MQLTGKQIAAEGIITGFCEEAVQQQGMDVRVAQINALEGVGSVPSQGKTKLPQYRKIEPSENKWFLLPGYYEIILQEGCKMPSNRAMTFVQRSSLLRCGCIIRSSQFDAGFETEHMGTFMQVFHPVTIEVGARVAQALVMETADVANEDLYHGQWQNDKQRV